MVKTVNSGAATKTLQLRLKDKHSGFLRQQACAVNFAWNFVNELSAKHFDRKRAFLSAYDMQPYTKGAGAELGLHSQTIQAIQEEFVTRRNQFKRVKLRWRVSNPQSPKRSLGWVPFKASALRYKNGQVWYCGKALSLWDSYGLAQYELGPGSFSEDSRGRWYLNITVKVPELVGPRRPKPTCSVGVDLGLKECATTSAGDTLEGRWYRALEPKLATTQRARKKKRVRTIHAKIKNQRKDAMHKLSTALVKANAAIFVGDVASSKLVKTKMAKSTLDAGWSMLKTMLEYKSHQAGVVFEVVNEAYSTQTCSCCGSIPASSPKGRAGLGIREWTCSECGAVHDRDVNAARNILARGLARLAEETPLEDGGRATAQRTPAMNGGE